MGWGGDGAYIYIYIGVATIYRSEGWWDIEGFEALYK